MTATRLLRWRLPSLVFCTAALAGWWQANLPGNPDVSNPSAVPTRSSRPPRPPRNASRKAEPEHVRRLLAPVRAARTPEERQRAAIHLALTLPVAELAAWFDAEWYPFRDGIDVNVFYRLTRQRWQEEDPAGYLNRALVKKPDDTNEAAHLWAKRDPEAALAWLHALTDPRDFTAMADSVYYSLAMARPALALAEIAKLRGVGVVALAAVVIAQGLQDHPRVSSNDGTCTTPRTIFALKKRGCGSAGFEKSRSCSIQPSSRVSSMAGAGGVSAVTNRKSAANSRQPK